MKITLVDDHPLFADSIKLILLQQNNIDEVTTYSNGSDFLLNCKTETPDIIILDLMMPGIDGLKVLENYCNIVADRKAKIIILSFIENSQTIKQALKLGASGFMSKTSTIDEVVQAINEVAGGNKFISKKLGSKLIRDFFENEPTIFSLTDNEKEILELVCKGFSPKEIAGKKEISYHTAQYYIRSIMSKFNVSRTADLIVFAMLHGLYIPENDRFH
jgi:DNA-binding NarL/FixJ family response regulator